MHLYPSHPHPHVLPQICAVVASTLQSQRDLPRWESRLSGERQLDLCQFCGCMQFPQHLFPPERPQPDLLPSPPFSTASLSTGAPAARSPPLSSVPGHSDPLVISLKFKTDDRIGRWRTLDGAHADSVSAN
ncbi:uncharacterized protein [Triticum aestivum]|uniref:uncharacterized protein n=1 Tax=Triticum aestivum TaxID=4565 RepID=UPI001D019A5E|nr:uncharacterized protein LOC123077354 [Triticum aestivum]